MSAQKKNGDKKPPGRVRMPVKFIDGHWELLYGGAIKIKNGCIGDLEVSGDQIDDEAFLAALTQARRVRILGEGVELRMALTIRERLAEGLQAHVVGNTEIWTGAKANISPESRFVSVLLGTPTKLQALRKESIGGLWLRLKGTEPVGLESSAVNLPEALKLEPAISVNHAFTALSELYEPWRKSHTGNIYERVFFQESNKIWYPLDTLRKQELAVAEHQIISSLWQEVTRMLAEPL